MACPTRKWKSSKSPKFVLPENIYYCVSVYLTDTHFVLRIGVSVKQQFTEEDIYKDRDSQISAIEKTFEDAQKSVSELITRLLKYLPTALYSRNQ